MIRWRETYEYYKTHSEFIRIFGAGGKPPASSAFRAMTLVQTFLGTATLTTTAATNMPFPSGAMVLGITSAAYNVQPTFTASGPFFQDGGYDPGNRSKYGLNFTYSGGEAITPSGPALASDLLSEGFPCHPLLIPASQSILCAVTNYSAATLGTVTVSYHCMVPRVVG